MTELHDAQKFVGTWVLVSQETQHPDGRAVPSRGSGPLGIIIYDSAGNMAVQLMRTDSRATEFHDMADFETAMQGYLAYFGRYDVDADAHRVYHHVIGSSYFGYRGVVLTREYEFTGDTLTLRGRSADGASIRVLVWRRVG